MSLLAVCCAPAAVALFFGQSISSPGTSSTLSAKAHRPIHTRNPAIEALQAGHVIPFLHAVCSRTFGFQAPTDLDDDIRGRESGRRRCQALPQGPCGRALLSSRWQFGAPQAIRLTTTHDAKRNDETQAQDHANRGHSPGNSRCD